MKSKPTYQELEDQIQELKTILKEKQDAEKARDANTRLKQHLSYYIQVDDFEETTRIGYQKLFSEAIIPIFLIDPTNNTIIDVNHATEKLTGYRRSELVGAHISKIVQEDEVDANNLLKHVERNDDLRQFNSIIHTKDNNEKIIDTNYSFYNFRGKKLIQVIGIDITDRRIAELALEEREKELSRLNDTKNLFFSIIGHDLKSPFNSILGFADLLMENYDELDTVEQKQYIAYIYEGLHNAFKILENLLLWSRSQMDKITFTPEKLNLYFFSKEASELYKFSLSNKSISFLNNIPTHLNVWADKDMLSAILRNLISNAIKYTPKKGKIRLEAQIIYLHKQQFVEVKVVDNGVGIQPEIASKLFNIENKTSTLGTQDECGTGLGLSICRDFVHTLGGHIRVESEPGIGSSFLFTLPYYEK